MKQLSLLVLLLCVLAITTRATTFSGTVTNLSTGAPIASVKVFIYDSTNSFLYKDSTLTNASGQYSFTIPSFVTGGSLSAYTTACGGAYSRGATYYTGYNMTGQDMGVCGVTYTLQGSLVGVVDTPHRSCYVYLIRKAYDPVLADTTLTEIGQTVAYHTNSFSATFTNLPGGGTLLVKAAMEQGDSQYLNYVPTYADSSLQWNSARSFSTSNISSSFVRIYMKAGVNPGGPGFIGGSVIAGANKSTAAGDPLDQRIIFLTNATTGKAVGYTYSNTAGKFSFSNLPIGTYKLFGDVWGKKNPAITVTITSTGATVNNVLFKENRKDFSGQIGGLGVAGANPLLSGVSAYPNPAAEYVEVGGLAAISGSKTVELRTISGALINRQEVGAGQTPRIATALLAPGMYLLQVQTEAGSVQLKLVK